MTPAVAGTITRMITAMAIITTAIRMATATRRRHSSVPHRKSAATMLARAALAKSTRSAAGSEN